MAHGFPWDPSLGFGKHRSQELTILAPCHCTSGISSRSVAPHKRTERSPEKHLPERRGGEIKLGVIWTLKLPISTPPEFNMYIKDVYRFFYTYIIAHKESEDDGLHPQNGHHQNCQIHARSRWWVFFTIFWHLGGEDPIFTFSHHSAFEFCIGETELRVAWTRCWSHGKKHFLNLTYTICLSQHNYDVWIFEPDIPSHTTHAWYISLHSLWFFPALKYPDLSTLTPAIEV